jgi:hypothetical protein
MQNSLLFIDGVINLILGILLLIFPLSVVTFLGLPGTEGQFYAQILGAVLTGIGIALFIERFRQPHQLVGLGLAGAISINLCGGIVLSLWLLFGSLSLSLYGTITLWLLVLILIGLSLFELIGIWHTKTHS